MAEFLQVTGMPQAIPNGLSKDIRFILSVSEKSLMCRARYGVAAQIASGLGTALRMLRVALAAEGTVEPVAAEDIQEIHIQKTLLADAVVVELVTTLGIPYIFQIPSRMAAELADRLKIEAAKHIESGRA
jgi:hypothetical protein